ncbi:MAG: Asp-tRNA(Asn)/Glu-tRNA(Gln) amidotransferase subunit GatB [Candidatus Niyogibacteria bacterium CG10_big_fil_rev_8_21_14_0_10_46_36]|uniref:Aspartyl/glutamyl-tRNA(Asn/Gln) amidotransferase subunit B n=1 Tax=Candidatus Niyogibacteria bacterium CG10_big_fil_rev_8_21_14_0_10_46_36 TaxID=1974726 RepID=A0A2H0TDA0_9BACT|nr:MAG: Asp-tRNA(Asn)/Glu-tRNA(Gln) amidotransferase subunit GatB [Candidatus Niyogibacteria bacterium CG10_big_fil_rev_8_21_14_0_10_46_36]
MEYQPTIGLEIHAELKMRTKMFCDSKNDPFEAHPNVNVCPVCMGHPGTLPVANKEAIRHILRIGLALEGEIPEYSQFDRKNYFYPDLPKGYQISQYKHPFVERGRLYLPKANKEIRITRVHLEEDAGKLVHEKDGTLVDFNRAGVPLMEMVTEPDFGDAAEVREFAEEFQRILRYLDASDADMEKGHMRIEANISIAKPGEQWGTKVEVKNLNSFRAVERAIAYEIERQAEVLDKGEKVSQETRGWDEEKQKTFSQRSKEEAHDYRYFPEPDLPPVRPHGEFDIEVLRAGLPELPAKRRERLVDEYGLSGDALIMALDDVHFLAFLEAGLSELFSWAPEAKKEDIKKIALNYLTSDLQGIVKEKGTSWNELLLTPENFAELIKMVHAGEISSRVAKDVLLQMVEENGDPSQIVEEKGLKQVSDAGALEVMVQKVIAENPDAVADVKSGKENAIKFLVGQAMKATKGSANPGVVEGLLKKLIS